MNTNIDSEQMNIVINFSQWQPFDNKWFQIINQEYTNPFFDRFFPMITDLHKNATFAVPILLMIMLFFLDKYGRKGVSYFLFLILTLSLNDFIGGKVKRAFERPRPFTVTELKTIQRTEASPNTSFYSNHSANMFCLAMFISLFFPVAKWFTFPMAALVAYSRIYNGVHYPSDVLFGGLVGMVISLIVFWLIKKLTSDPHESIRPANKHRLKAMNVSR